MRTAEAVAWCAAAGSVLLTGWRGRSAAARIAAGADAPSAEPTDVTVLVPIRSGDPLLAASLGASVRTLAPARVELLVDEDDPDGIAAADQVARGQAHVRVLRCAPPPPGVNPKVHKLIAPAAAAPGPVALIDDDTVLPPRGLARLRGALGADCVDCADGAGCGLVTGLPRYREQGGPWSRLVAAFVNGSAALTYLPLADDPVTVNGMVLLIDRGTLDRIGGLGVIAGATCDDYALARAVRAAGGRIVQTTQWAEVATTVSGPGEYLRLMRRWLLFGTEVIRHDGTPRVLAAAVLPAALPTVGLTAAALARSPRATAGVLGAVLAGAAVARRLTGGPRSGAALLPMAALLTPVLTLAAVLGPRRVRWRGRSVVVGSGFLTPRDRDAATRAEGARR